MNEYQLNLYNNLSQLVKESKTFYFQDFDLNDTHYRIFNYRLAVYTEFCRPSATECRGHMFEVDQDGQPVRLAALPMEKFFNLYENPMTMDLDLSQIDTIMLKADGSLISTYMHNDQLRLKSKGSLFSDQACAAMLWLEEHKEFRDELEYLTRHYFTVNLEWCAPDNRIVVGYSEPTLTVLNIRCNSDGRYFDLNDIGVAGYGWFGEIHKHWISYEDPDDKVQFVHNIPQMQGVEGYVVRLNSGQFVKIKTEWYLVQHRAKDSINSPRRLYEVVLEEATDDMRSLFHDDPLAIKRIGEMETEVERIYNHLVDSVERFYERNKHLDRKEFAILGQQELVRMYFGLAMMKYTGREVDYKDFMKSHWKDFGIRDVEDEVKE